MALGGYTDYPSDLAPFSLPWLLVATLITLLTSHPFHSLLKFPTVSDLLHFQTTTTLSCLLRMKLMEKPKDCHENKGTLEHQLLAIGSQSLDRPLNIPLEGVFQLSHQPSSWRDEDHNISRSGWTACHIYAEGCELLFHARLVFNRTVIPNIRDRVHLMGSGCSQCCQAGEVSPQVQDDGNCREGGYLCLPCGFSIRPSQERSMADILFFHNTYAPSTKNHLCFT